MERQQAVRDALRRREPIFHRVEHGTRREDFEAMTADDFWETGASGRAYDRAFVLGVLEQRFADPTYDPLANTEVDDFAVREAGGGVWLATYRLRQGDRRTRRLSVWREGEAGWKALYRHGTVISDESA
jgi:hypothetical protein